MQVRTMTRSARGSRARPGVVSQFASDTISVRLQTRSDTAGRGAVGIPRLQAGEGVKSAWPCFWIPGCRRRLNPQR